MAFYDSVKKKVSEGSGDGGEDGEVSENDVSKKGDGKVAFDQLIEDSKDRKNKLEPEDDSNIEDFSSGGLSRNGDYGDLSKIELKDDLDNQAGKVSKKDSKNLNKGSNSIVQSKSSSRGTSSIKSSSVVDRVRNQSGSNKNVASNSQQVSSSSESSGQRKEGMKEVVLSADGSVKDADENVDVESAGSSKKRLLRDIKEQNNEMISLLREIRDRL